MSEQHATPSDTLTPASVCGYGTWLELGMTEHALLHRAHEAVAAACTASPPEVDEPRPSLPVPAGAAGRHSRRTGPTPEAGTWRSDIERDAQLVPATRRALIAIALCTVPMTIAPQTLTTQVAVRRMDAVLDLMDVPLSSVAVQAAFLEAFQSLTNHEGASSTSEVGRAARATRQYTEYLGWFHPALGVAADIGFRFLDGHHDPSTAVRGAQADVEAITRALLACRLAFSGPEQRAHAEDIHTRLLSQLQTPQVVGHVPHIVLASAAAAFASFTEANVPAQDAPDTTGLTLATARQIMSTLGLTCRVEDDLKPAGKTRFIMSDANWNVTAQGLTATGDLELRVRKNTDPST